jgi:four helix bundle protein
MPVRNYRDLIAWKKAFELASEVYHSTKNFPSEEKYGLTSQLSRGSVSIASNIAEGEGRHSSAEFRHFLFIAHGSLRELEAQILISESLGFLKPDVSSKLMGMAAEVGRLINGLCRSLRKNLCTTAHCRLPTVH